jgi:putative transport protein
MLQPLIDLLARQPLLLLFLVAAIGYPLGRIRFRGSGLGSAAVLFVGLAFGALHPSLALPEIVYQLGLSVFVYMVGLSSGRAFLASLRRDGLRFNLLAVAVIGLGVALAWGFTRLLGLGPALGSGMLAGAVTNTPALASAIETLKQLAPDRPAAEAVVAYSICYPFGVIGVVLAIRVAWLLFRPDLSAEAKQLADVGATNEPITSLTVRVTRDMGDLTLEQLSRAMRWRVIFGRLRRGERTRLAGPDERPEPGDLLSVVGTQGEIDKAVERLGEVSAERLDHDRSEFDLRRVFVSSPKVIGRTIGELDLARTQGAVITRVRRGDLELIPEEQMRLEAGDRVRVLGPHKLLPRITELFGDSFRAASEVDILTFGAGLALGLGLGVVPFPLPGGLHFSLGLAGGPLVVALILGAAGATGRLSWNLPFSANVALRQFGLIVFLAAIGTRAGQGFLATFASPQGALLFAGGALVTFTVALTTLVVAHRLLRVPMSLAMGMVAGVHTQPAVLGYALERTRNDVPNLGWAAVYPAATLAKLVLIQVLAALG